MKKLLTLITLIAILCTIGLKVSADAPKDVWCATFQLTWNELMKKVVHGPVEFVNGNPEIADELNKQNFKKDMISKDSYYIVCDKKSPALKKRIERDIKRKFNEKSDILDKFDWSRQKGKAYFIYAMLVKNFEFPVPFDILKPAPFADSDGNYKYFGMTKNSDYKMLEDWSVLFYNSENDYAVKLKSKKDEDVILYRNDVLSADFEELYKEVLKKKSKKRIKIQDEDTLKVPFIKVNEEISYDELTGREIKNTDRLYIAKALQTIKFEMDNKGGKLKSEAAMDIMKMSMPLTPARHYNFDNKFVLFLKESSKSKPYFALKVEDGKYLVKQD